MTAECIHELNPAWCATCTPRAGAEVADQVPAKAFQAAFAGTCAGCGDPIAVGDLIVGLGIGRGYAHGGCS